MYAFSPATLSEDWLRCYEAHAAAKEQWALFGTFCPEACGPFFQHLSELKSAFKSVHGIEFDPNSPIVVAELYEIAEERRDFDFSVEAHNSEIHAEAYSDA